MKHLIDELRKLISALFRWFANLLEAPPGDERIAGSAAAPGAYKESELGLASGDRPQYRRSKSVLSPNERILYSAIVDATRGAHVILMKVRVGDFVFLANEPADRRHHLNQLMCKHVDFLLCEPDSLRPLLVIEQDDARHAHNEYRIASDRFKTETFQQVAIPLLRLPVQSSYDAVSLAAQISTKISSAQQYSSKDTAA